MLGPARWTNTAGSSQLSEDAFRNLIESLQAPSIQADKSEREPRGRGHYAVVYKGTAVVESYPVPVALKIFHNNITREEVERLTRVIIRETRVWSKLKHPNLLPFYGIRPEMEVRQVWLVSPWIENGNLSQYLHTDRHADCVALCRGIVRGVHYLHSVHVLHGDIKPANVLIDNDGTPLLSDFGLSRLIEELSLPGMVTTSLYQGSMRWMAPERIRPTVPGLTTSTAHSFASDVYAVGMTMYEVFALETPFRDLRDPEVVESVLAGTRMHHPGNRAIFRGMNSRIWEFIWETWGADRGKRPRLQDALQTVLYESENTRPGSSHGQLRGITRIPYTSKHWLELNLIANEPVFELEVWDEGLYLGKTLRGEKGVFPCELIQLDDEVHNPQIRVEDIPTSTPIPSELQALLSDLAVPIVRVTKQGDKALHGGGFSDVWRGIMRPGDTPVALKIPRLHLRRTDPHTLYRAIIREVSIWAKLDDRNVLPFLGVRPHAENLWLVSPWMENGHLMAYLRGRDHGADRLPLVLGVTSGLAYLHRNGIVHGDLKSNNVLIDEEGQPRLADFGMSRVLDDILPELSTSSMFAGSSRWMPPERLDPVRFGLRAAACRTTSGDMHSLAMTLYEIFSLRQPFDAHSYGAVVAAAVLRGERPLHPGQAAAQAGLTTEIWEYMQLCWREDPTERPMLTQLPEFLRSSQT